MRVIAISLYIRYDPYSKKFTREYYDHEEMRSTRKRLIREAMGVQCYGVILGTLDRQGSPRILSTLKDLLAIVLNVGSWSEPYPMDYYAIMIILARGLSIIPITGQRD